MNTLQLFGSFPGGGGSASASEAVNILLFLLCGFENLEMVLAICKLVIVAGQIHTWNEQRRLSSTLIMAPALSNSPQ